MNEFPRPLSSHERALLDHLLSYDFPGVEALRVQAHTVVVKELNQGDPRVLVFEVTDSAAPRAEVADVVPIEAPVHDATPPIEVLLFVKGGLLNSLEVVDYGPQLRSRLPSPAELGAVRLRGVFDGWRR